jgi:two-component system chemotaxis response regulator CheB
MLPSQSETGKNADLVRVMIVDDSAVVRGLITRMLEAEAGIQVVSSVSNGQMAISALTRTDVDVILLDIEMPVMDGISAISKLLEVDPGVRIIMSSTLTLKGAGVTMQAMQLGAADYVPKPSAARDISGGVDFRTDLIAKIKAWGAARRRNPRKGAPPPSARPLPPPAPAGTTRSASAIGHGGPVVLRPMPPDRPDVIAIGSSTGGPQALFAVLGQIKPGTLQQPILITQHMPATFTAILGEHISRVSGWEAAEARDGEPLRSGRIYIAPGDFHMIVETHGTEKVIRTNKNPPENFCRPAVDPMLRSLAAVYGRRVLAVILTGMGADGLKGGQALVAAGGALIAQDEASSVVWGMPGAVATAGICSAVLPLSGIADFIIKTATRR